MGRHCLCYRVDGGWAPSDGEPWGATGFGGAGCSGAGTVSSADVGEMTPVGQSKGRGGRCLEGFVSLGVRCGRDAGPGARSQGVITKGVAGAAPQGLRSRGEGFCLPMGCSPSGGTPPGLRIKCRVICCLLKINTHAHKQTNKCFSS